MIPEDEKLDRILAGLVDSILEAPESEIDDDLRAAGDDPDLVAESLRSHLGHTLELHHRQRLAFNNGRVQRNLITVPGFDYEFPEGVVSQGRSRSKKPAKPSSSPKKRPAGVSEDPD